MSGGPPFLLTFLTFILFAGFPIWSRISVLWNHVTGGMARGLRGPGEASA